MTNKSTFERDFKDWKKRLKKLEKMCSYTCPICGGVHEGNISDLLILKILNCKQYYGE